MAEIIDQFEEAKQGECHGEKRDEGILLFIGDDVLTSVPPEHASDLASVLLALAPENSTQV